MKRIFTLALAVIISITASAQFKVSSNVRTSTKTKVVSTSEKTTFHGGTPYATTQKAQWDVLFTFDAVEAASPGIETNGTYFYTTTWNAGNFHRYDMDGSNATTFTVGSISAIRDLAYDGTYFYGSPASMTIYVMDLDNETQIGTITVDGGSGITGVRHIAYDPMLDGGNGGFWVGNWDELAAIDMSGNTLVDNSSTPTMNSAYGSAYDPWTDPANPKLWIATQPATTSNAVFEEFDINTLTLTGVVHDVISDVPNAASDALSGGACTYEADGKFILAGSLQQDPNLVFGYELAVTADQSAPAAPTNFVVTPVDGTNDATITWTNPSEDVAGNALAELTAVTVMWEDSYLYTNTTPVIGGNEDIGQYGAFTPGFNTFTVYGENSNGAGIPTSTTVWIGEDVPDAPTNIVLTATDMQADLSWDAPVVGAHGAYFTGTGLTYDVVRYPDMTLVADDISATTFTETLALPGNYYYEVIASNAIGEGNSDFSNVVLFGDFIIYESFDTVMPADWIITDGGATADTWYVETSYGGSTLDGTSFAFVDSDAAGSVDMDEILETPTLNLSAYGDLYLEFDHLFNSYSGADIGDVDVYDGTQWVNVYTTSSDVGVWGAPDHQMIDVSAYVNSEFAVRFHYYNANWDWYWAVDNVKLYGTLLLGAEVTFIVDDGTNPVEGAYVYADGNMATTDALGEATMFLVEGDQTYTVTAFGYQDVTGSVTVVDGVPADELVTLTPLPDYTVSFNIENAIAEPLDAFVTVYYGGMEIYTGTATAGAIDFMLPDGDYTFDVIMDGYVSEIGGTFSVTGSDMDVDVVLEEDMLPVQSLTYSQTANDITLNWVDPFATVIQPQWIQYDDGINSDGIGTGGAAYFAVAHRYEPADIAEFEGGVISMVEFFPKEVGATYTITIWQGPDAANLTPVYTELVTSPTIDAYNTITLATEVPIDVTQELWIGYMVTTTTGYPAGCDAGPAVAGYGDMIYFGGAWQSMANDIGLDYNWNIHAYVDAPSKAAKDFTNTYNVYLDGALQTVTPTSDLFYDFVDLAPGTYSATVTAVYTTGESDPEQVDFAIFDYAPITFVVENSNPAYTGFELKGSWDADGNYDATWNGGAVQATFNDNGDGTWSTTVQLMADGGANTWEWGVNDQDGNWIDGNFQFQVIDPSAQTLTYIIVSLNEVFANVTLSPNPTNGLISISANDMYDVQVIDVNGKVISTVNMTSNNTTIDISNVEAGLYFVNLSKDGETATYKIIKK